MAFPAISCGVFGYPLSAAAAVALRTCREHAGGLAEIWFVLFDDRAFSTFREFVCETGGSEL